MDSILPSDQYTEVEGRLYVNPQTGLEESSTFIDKLREAQGAQNQEIIEQTQALGTNIPSVQGGLTGSESYFTSRYQTPQNVSAVANLRAAAQAQALNEVLANEQEIWKKRYQDAYRAYQKSQYDKIYGGGDEKEKKLPIDVNGGNTGEGVADENTNTGVGKYVPVTDYVGDYLSEDGSQWWQLGSLMKSDELNFLGQSLGAPSNGSTRTINGITYMYLKNGQFPNGRWFRAAQSAGPGTYSPYAGGE